MKLRNPGPRAYIANTPVPRPGNEITVIADTRVITAGQVAELDPEVRSVQRAVLRGLLIPIDADGEKWLAGLRKPQSRKS